MTFTSPPLKFRALSKGPVSTMLSIRELRARAYASILLERPVCLSVRRDEANEALPVLESLIPCSEGNHFAAWPTVPLCATNLRSPWLAPTGLFLATMTRSFWPFPHSRIMRILNRPLRDANAPFHHIHFCGAGCSCFFHTWKPRIHPLKTHSSKKKAFWQENLTPDSRWTKSKSNWARFSTTSQKENSGRRRRRRHQNSFFCARRT